MASHITRHNPAAHTQHHSKARSRVNQARINACRLHRKRISNRCTVCTLNRRERSSKACRHNRQCRSRRRTIRQIALINRQSRNGFRRMADRWTIIMDGDVRANVNGLAGCIQVIVGHCRLQLHKARGQADAFAAVGSWGCVDCGFLHPTKFRHRHFAKRINRQREHCMARAIYAIHFKRTHHMQRHRCVGYRVNQIGHCTFGGNQFIANRLLTISARGYRKS